jgi:hypothetical protein
MTCTKATRDASSVQTWTYSQPMSVAIDHAGLAAGDAMPHRANAAELLDVDVMSSPGFSRSQRRTGSAGSKASGALLDELQT